jgi:hypothetical protein
MSEEKPSMEYMLTTRYSGGFVTKPETAQKIVEAVMAEMTGEDGNAQGPFHISDQGDRWIIQGGRARELKAEDPGTIPITIDPVTFVIKKVDGQIVDYRSAARYKLDPEAERLVRDHLNSKDE